MKTSTVDDRLPIIEAAALNSAGERAHKRCRGGAG